MGYLFSSNPPWSSSDMEKSSHLFNVVFGEKSFKKKELTTPEVQ